MKADSVPRGIGDPRHPAHAGLDGRDENLHAPPTALRNGVAHVVDGERDARGALPVPLGADGFREAVEAEREWRGGEFAPELRPLVAAPEAEKFW